MVVLVNGRFHAVLYARGSLMTYSITDMRHMTQDYWNLLAEGNHQEAMTFYLQQARAYYEPIEESLLELEMRWAKAQDHLPTPHQKTTLVILVGESYDPLLQSIWAYNPVKLVPIVNKYYGDKDESSIGHKSGQDHWQNLRRWIALLLQRSDRNLFPLPDNPELVTDNPTMIFEHLRQVLEEDLLDPDTRVVIDITGAKKPMVTGAFLLATYSKTEINYIDIGEYEQAGQKRPYGFSCEFKSVSNPLDDLFLPNWERAKRHYQRYDFDDALAALPEVANLPGNGLQHLRGFLKICDLWENGLLYEALTKTNDMPDHLLAKIPITIRKLGPYWPKPNDMRLNNNFFRDPVNIILFAEDELRRARRLQKHGLLRLAFTRAYALYETFLTARIIALYMSDQIKLESGKGTRSLFKVEEELAWFVNLPAENSKNLLITGTQKWAFKYEGTDYKPRISQRISKMYLPKEKLRKTRNLITHTYFPVTPKLVVAAIVLAEINLKDYKNQWATMHDPQLIIKEGKVEDKVLELISEIQSITVKETDFIVPSWETLMELCKLSRFVTPKNR